jgi:hypothetical protein
MGDWRRSGLSVREFCDWQELSEASFYAWRRELARRDNEVAPAASSRRAKSARRGTRKGLSRAAAPGFVPVRVVADAAPEASHGGDGIEVRLLTGVRLLVPPGCDRALLRDVIACCGGMAREASAC